MDSLWKKYRNFSIWTKLMIGFLAVLIPIASMLVIVLYTYSSNIISQKTLEQTSETVEQFSNSLDNYMTLMINKMEIMADSPVIQEELNAEEDEVNVVSDSFYARSKQDRKSVV